MSYYSGTGQFKWSAPAGGVDVALGPTGTVYVSTFSAVVALNKDTGQPLWPASVVTNNGNESSALAIDNNGTIYFRTGSSQVGPSPKLTAINPDGTIKWDAIVGIRGYERSIFSTDQSVIYIAERGLSPATGQVIYTPACTYYPYVFAPWNLLYTNDFNGSLQSLSPSLQSCSAVAGGLSFSGIVTTTNAGIIVLQQYPNNGLEAFNQQGNRLWTLPEHLTYGFSDGNGVIYARGNLTPQDGNAVERVITIGNRGDGKPAHVFEAGSSQTCIATSVENCPPPIPRPRLGKVKLTVSNGVVTVLSTEFIDLAPKYHATYFGQPVGGPCRLNSDTEEVTCEVNQGQRIPLTAQFRNLGTRTWFKTDGDHLRFYQLLNNRLHTAQSQALEVIIAVLLLVELVLAFQSPACCQFSVLFLLGGCETSVLRIEFFALLRWRRRMYSKCGCRFHIRA